MCGEGSGKCAEPTKKGGIFVKKSEAYRMAMYAVLRDGDIDFDETIDIMGVLIADRNSALWQEKREEAQ